MSNRVTNRRRNGIKVSKSQTRTMEPLASEKSEELISEKTALTSHKEESNSFLSRSHTLTVLILISILLAYLTIFQVPATENSNNMKRGVIGVILVFIAVASLHMPDGPFLRPHPLLWRTVMGCSVVYLLSLVYLLFQDLDDVRHIVSVLDPSLGRPLPERTYAENCDIYTPENQNSSFANVFDKMDVFVFSHFFGWCAKAFMLRDFWILNFLSFLFEIMEYSLEHQFPNFGECWWDHWILDFLLCNGGGICIGMFTLKYLNVKTFKWSSLYNISASKSKYSSNQVKPCSGSSFRCEYMEKLYIWLIIWGMVIFFTIVDLNSFYLKAILWLPPNHEINFYRLLLFSFMGSVAIKQVYEYLDGKVQDFGSQVWITAFIIMVEVIFAVKFGEEIYGVPWPNWVLKVSSGTAVLWIVYTIFYFNPFRRESDKS